MQLTVDPVIYQQRASGGIKRYFDALLPRLCDYADDLAITYLRDPAYAGYKAAPPHLPCSTTRDRRPTPALRIPLQRPYRLWRGIEKTTTYALSRPYHIQTQSDIWHSTYYTLPPYGWGGAQVVTVYDLIYFLYADQFNRPVDDAIRQQQHHAINQADIIISISQTTAADLQQHLGITSANIHTIYLGIDDERFHRLSPVTASDIIALPFDYILYLGGREAHKNFDGLLRVYRRWSHRPDIKLVVVGIPFTDHELALLETYEIADDVHLLSNIDDTQLCALYNQAAAFVYPSFYEGFGIPLLEAMHCACPVVASDIPTTAEVGAEFPFFFNPGDDDSFIYALDEAITTPRDASRIQNAVDHAQQFTWDATAQATLDVYRRLH